MFSFCHLFVLHRFNVGHAIAFDAPRLILDHTSELVSRTMKSVVVHDIEFGKSLERILGDMTHLGRHSAIIHITPESVLRYVWAHQDTRPWGWNLPMQCPQCGVIQKWLRVSNGKGIQVVTCVNQDCGMVGNKRIGNRISLTFTRPKDAIQIHKNPPMCWLKIPLDM